MSSGCPPQSPAVAKSEVAVEGECPLLAATFAYWDNILGPRVRHIWTPKADQLMFLSDGEVTFLANHTLNGEILRSAECGAVDVKFFVLAEKGVIIVSLIFDGELKGDKNTCALSIILPQTELAFYLPLHTICVDRLKHVIRKGRIWMQKGYNIISVLSLEIVPIMELLASMKTHSVPEDIDDSTGSFVLPFRQVLYSPYPTTHIDVDINTVKQMPPCHEHTYNQRRYMRSELSALWKTDSEEDIPPDTIIHTDETFTPDLNIFQDVMHKDTLVKSFIDEVFMLKPGLSLRSTYLSQFLLLLHRKALTLLKYIEDETQKGKKPFRSLRNLKTDLDLTVEGDLNIVMAFAEKLRAGLHSFVFGKPFYTSMQERDVLMSF
ncbi:guanine nucleotide exchange factor C9orf72 homolog isoform X3 [Epinephelus moara]|uniref:guanine nucleotide exchange factor C9orf72 homolog isoform X3 n=1 Tax=Epinephelus moara TaxID=300413 RepID=UPI00214E5DE2|nr:guanine nucleotide exchange factor C9orf72 homolog isoform X3 [Epinephelus moara]